MFRVTADTNIYIFRSDVWRSSAALLRAARHGGIELAISDPLLDEILDVLQRKFLLLPHNALENVRFIQSFTRRVHPTRVIDAISEDPDDNRVLECATENVSDFVVTHDKDLLRLKRFEGIPIIKVGPFLDRGFGIKSSGKRR